MKQQQSARFLSAGSGRSCLALLFFLAALVTSQPGHAAELRVVVTAAGADEHGGLWAVMTGDHEFFLEAEPLAGEGLYAFSRRLTGGRARAADIRRAHGGRSRLYAGRRYRLPLDWVTEPLRRRALAALLPGDGVRPGEWVHEVRDYDGLPQESLWRVAARFTGDGRNHPQLRRHNALPDNGIYRGQKLRLPADLLLPLFRNLVPDAPSGPVETVGEPATVTAAPPTGPAVPTAPIPEPPLPRGESPPATETPEAQPTTSTTRPTGSPAAPVREPNTYDLEYVRDGDQEFAVYRLKAGEAIYSAVVVRFTGRIYATDVNALSAQLAQLNGIEDVTDMPIGFPVRIPFDLLQPEFLPPGHPRRQEYEEAQLASAQFSNTVRSRDLAGITIVLDAGHGGRDPGASKDGVWESLYVYDILLRLRQFLQERTSAEVHTTVRDGDSYRIIDRDVLPYTQGHKVLTDPPYDLGDGDPRVGVNLRWYLSNSLYRRAQSQGRNHEQVLFLSIHADSLHPSIRGAMVYIPDAHLRRGSYQKSGRVYTSRREVREQPRVSFSNQERTRSQGLSRQLAEELMDAFRDRDLGIHPDQPIRQKIYRGRRPWVPAVLRYNAVPASVLVEVCNLANSEDRKLLQSREFRQHAAEAIAAGILAYYENSR